MSCTHGEMQDALPELTSVGPYLTTLTHDLRLLEKQLPLFAEARQRRARYVVSDPFLSAWLNVLQPACQAARIQPASQVAQRLLPRLATLEGHAFERLVRDASEDASHTGARDFPMTDRVRGYWNRPQRATGTATSRFTRTTSMFQFSCGVWSSLEVKYAHESSVNGRVLPR